MSVWLRRGAWVLVALLVLVVAIAAWFVMSFDADRVKGMAVDWMKTNRNRTLVIAGPVELSVFPRLSVQLSGVTLSEAGKPEVFASLDEAGLAIDVLPLLRGHAVVDSVLAKGVRFNYLRDAQGRSNIDDLLKPSADKPSQGGGGKSLSFDISAIHLNSVRAHVKDDHAGVIGNLWLKSFTSGRLVDRGEAPVKLAAQVDMKVPKIRGELSGGTRLFIDTTSSSLALKDMKLDFRGDVPGASAVEAIIEGSMAWNGATRAASAESLSLQLSGNAAGLKLAGSTLAIEHFLLDPANKSLTLRRLLARAKGTHDGQPMALELDWPELAVAADKLSGSAFTGKLSRGGDLPLEASFKSAAPSGNFDAVRLPGFEAQFTSRTPQRSVQGSLRSELTLKPSPAALSFDKLRLQGKVEQPNAQPLALSLTGQAHASAQRSSWNLAGQLNNNRFASEGNATLTGETPHVVARARFDSLNVNSFTSPAPAAAASAPGAADTPVDFSGLRKVDGQFSLQAGRLAYRHYRLADTRLEATLDAGLLRIVQLQTGAWGGQIHGSGSADARTQRVALRGSAYGVDVNALVQDVAAKDIIEGTGRVNVDVVTSGRSVNEMQSRLDGKASLQVRNGALRGINLAKTMRQAKAALAMRADAAQKARETEKTDFSELNVSFDIKDGVARSSDLDLKSPFLRLGGEGAIDIGRGRIDYLARATVTPTSKGQGGAELEALRGLTVPVRLAGPFDALAWKVEWSAVAKAAVGKQLQEKVGEKLAEKLGARPPAGAASAPSPKDALKEKLKGLFK